MDKPAQPTPSLRLVRNILFCTDFSENADLAFAFALSAAAARPGAVLHLLHVIPEPEAQFWKTYIYEVDDVDQKAKRDIDERVEAYRQRLPENVPFRPSFRIGRDHVEILKFAQEHNIDLIVMGRQGHSGIERVFFGNVTEKVARKAPCPVLIVPWDYQHRQAAHSDQPLPPNANPPANTHGEQNPIFQPPVI